jgi:hypothetical protein
VEVRQARAVRGTSLRKGTAREYFLEKRGVRRLLGAVAPGSCLTWGPAAELAASARVAREQLARTMNPRGWPGAASSKAAFTDVVPRSMPRVTDRAAMAVVTSAAQVSYQLWLLTLPSPRRAAWGRSFPTSLSATPNMAAPRLTIGRERRALTRPSWRAPAIGEEAEEGGS